MKYDKIIEDTFNFHGHKCWASAVGAKAGLAALRELNVERAHNANDLHCILEIGDNHGAQCFADGVQYTTGCTLGKNCIEKTGWGKLAFTLIDKDKQKSVRVSYKPTRHKQISESTFMRKKSQGMKPSEIPEEDINQMLGIILDAPDEEILSIGEVKGHAWEEYGEIMGLHPCDICGELVAAPYLRVVGDKRVCIPCSGYEV